MEEFAARKSGGGPRSDESLLSYHTRSGRLVRVRRGLYCVVPAGIDADRFLADPYLVAGKATEDAVIGYHSALSFHGVAYSVSRVFTFLTEHSDTRSFVFQGCEHRPVSQPRVLVEAGRKHAGVQRVERQGVIVRVTSLERTLVDCLDRLDLSGGIEEVWRSLEAVSYFETDQIVRYALALRNATTIAKVGVFLELNQDRLMVPAKTLTSLRKHAPKDNRYMFRNRRKGSLVSGWNLIVPSEILDRKWEEPA